MLSSNHFSSQAVHYIYQDNACARYTSPAVLANHVDDFYGNQKDIRILDVAAGTGLVGQNVSCDLYRQMFSHTNSMGNLLKLI